MKNYSRREADIITADSLSELTYKQKVALIRLSCSDKPQKYEDELIKTLDRGVYNKIRAKFSDASYREKVTENLYKKGVECVVRGTDGYPANLAATPVPPIVLYCKGNLSLLEKTRFAIVGSRRTSPQTAFVCRETSRELSKYFAIVTGVADGADSAAAEGALETGSVISVLPNGHDYFYPAGNENLIRRIAEEGLLVSEFTPETAPQKYMFHLRNRVLAGLSEGVLVVSAAERSGALITAGYAADYGRDVFAFPYNVGYARGAGCNNLIKNGAYLAEGSDDILSVYGLKKEEKAEITLEGDEKTALLFLKESGEAHITEIAAKLGIAEFEASAVCSMLEIKKLIVKTGGNRYAPVK